jgi:hypothetical protein
MLLGPAVRLVVCLRRLSCAAMLASYPSGALAFGSMTGRHRAVLSALRDAEHAREGEPVSAGQIAVLCAGPWHRGSDLVTQALWLLHAQGLVLRSAGAAGGWKITATGQSCRHAAAPPAIVPASAAHTAASRARAESALNGIVRTPPRKNSATFR